MSPMTAKRDLAWFLREGAFLREGKGRSTAYVAREMPKMTGDRQARPDPARYALDGCQLSGEEVGRKWGGSGEQNGPILDPMTARYGLK